MDYLRDLNGPNGGVPFAKAKLLQSMACLYQLERLMKERPIVQCVELGTYAGALAIWLGLHCPGRVVTIDITPAHITPHTKQLFDMLGVTFMCADALSAETVGRVAQMRKGPIFWFMDAGGNLKHECFELYTPLTKPGDIVVVHDLGYEFHITEQVENIVEKYHLVRWEETAQEEERTTLACWVVR